MTRMEEAKAGIVTEEIQKAALREGMAAERLRAGVAAGAIALVRNKLRSITPLAIGRGTRIKVNANIGTSSSKSEIAEELEKMRVAVRHGADAIMDLSTAGDLAAIRAAILAECEVPLGTVPIYEMASMAQRKNKSVLDLTADEMFDIIEAHCRQGVDFLTLHCGVNRATVARFKEVKRLAGASAGAGRSSWSGSIKTTKTTPSTSTSTGSSTSSL